MCIVTVKTPQVPGGHSIVSVGVLECWSVSAMNYNLQQLSGQTQISCMLPGPRAVLSQHSVNYVKYVMNTENQSSRVIPTWEHTLYTNYTAAASVDTIIQVKYSLEPDIKT